MLELLTKLLGNCPDVGVQIFINLSINVREWTTQTELLCVIWRNFKLALSFDIYSSIYATAARMTLDSCQHLSHSLSLSLAFHCNIDLTWLAGRQTFFTFCLQTLSLMKSARAACIWNYADLHNSRRELFIFCVTRLIDDLARLRNSTGLFSQRFALMSS